MAKKWPFRKAAGGFTGQILSIAFDDSLSGDTDRGAWRKLSALLTYREDGSEEDKTRYVDAGFLRNEAVQVVDGALVGGEDGPLEDDTELVNLVAAALNAGVPEELLDDAGRDLSGVLVGHRFEFGLKIDEERMIYRGKKKLGAKGAALVAKMEAGDAEAKATLIKAGEREGKGDHKGKSFKDYLLTINGLVALADDVPAAKPAKAASKAAKGRTNGQAGTPTSAPAPAEMSDEYASEALGQILGGFTGLVQDEAGIVAVKVDDLAGHATRYALKSKRTDLKEPLKARLTDTEFLATEQGWVFDADEKLVALA